MDYPFLPVGRLPDTCCVMLLDKFVLGAQKVLLALDSQWAAKQANRWMACSFVQPRTTSRLLARKTAPLYPPFVSCDNSGKLAGGVRQDRAWRGGAGAGDSIFSRAVQAGGGGGAESRRAGGRHHPLQGW